jgi:hypothetical protein
MAGLLAPREAPDLPLLRSGLRRGGPRLQVGRVGDGAVPSLGVGATLNQRPLHDV